MENASKKDKEVLFELSHHYTQATGIIMVNNTLGALLKQAVVAAHVIIMPEREGKKRKFRGEGGVCALEENNSMHKILLFQKTPNVNRGRDLLIKTYSKFVLFIFLRLIEFRSISISSSVKPQLYRSINIINFLVKILLPRFK